MKLLGAEEVSSARAIVAIGCAWPALKLTEMGWFIPRKRAKEMTRS